MPEPQPTWRRSVVDVVAIGVLVVAAVLGAAILTDFLPDPARRLILDTPLAILVLIGGTAWVLWRITRSAPAGDR